MIVLMTFDMFQTECSWDFLRIYNVDANTGSSTLLAQVCGNRTLQIPYDRFVSSGPSVVLDFSSDRDVESRGFIARYRYVSRCDNNCHGGGVCVNGQCQCYLNRTGTLCEHSRASSPLLTPRHQHAAVYDAGHDAMYLSGGQNMLGSTLPWDLLRVDLTTGQWQSIFAANGPSARYGHAMFMFNSQLYMFGGVVRNYGSTNELWRFDVQQQTWSLVQPVANGVAPPALDWPTVVAAEQEGLIFVLGGWTAVSGAMYPSRLMFAYSPSTNTWEQRNSSSHPFASFAATLGAPAIYRPESRFIHVFAHRTVQSYHVPSDLWYYDLVGPDTLPVGAYVYSAASLHPATGGNHALLFGGQLSPMQLLGAGDECMSPTIKVIDLDCFEVVAQQAVPGKGRTGHSAIARGDGSLVIAAGHNGQDLADVVAVPVAAPADPPGLRSVCRSTNWCARSNDCDDCVMKPGCGWCNGRCKYGCTTSQCPQRVPISLSQPHAASLTVGDATTFKIWINEPDLPIYLTLESTNGAFVTMSLINRDGLADLAQSTSSLAARIFYAADPRRWGGWYVLQVEATGVTDAKFRVIVGTQPYDNSDPLSTFLPTSAAQLGGIIGLLLISASRGAGGPNRPDAPPKRLALMYLIKGDDLHRHAQFPGLSRQVKSTASLDEWAGNDGSPRAPNRGDWGPTPGARTDAGSDEQLHAPSSDRGELDEWIASAVPISAELYTPPPPGALSKPTTPEPPRPASPPPTPSTPPVAPQFRDLIALAPVSPPPAPTLPMAAYLTSPVVLTTYLVVFPGNEVEQGLPVITVATAAHLVDPVRDETEGKKIVTGVSWWRKWIRSASPARAMSPSEQVPLRMAAGSPSQL
ncbi:hypothetical protein AMAG_11225 [Allomyces macrogynus ATCC 38327]|uniref:CUB domain-containing protein n=1 Tax=Allomyces macrogynus (strain ATCC 38327) TaxID=578462 RepID=A0A0L0SW35_ALLM3|nr:hypothetical protein AMAG_11225 [Allomyces macrogynus ATCC 38327]|eukprot:KNE66727.1 hypothetical protein AMAG_11225 [Allomyces macrogynus ATCC 38327]